MVSIVIPTYQSAGTIGACIESCLRQTMPDVQVVVVDDGSTDGSAEVMARMAATDSRIMVVTQPNRGRCEARAAGLDASQGEWVAFVDSDDTLPPDAIERLLAAASPDVDIVMGNSQSIGVDTATIMPMPQFRHHAVRSDGTIGVPWGSLYRRSVLSRDMLMLPRDMYMGEDYIFWLRLVFATDRPVALVPDAVYCKGPDHTSNSFVWTAAYAQRLDQYRTEAIPAAARDEYLADALSDRIANLCAVAVCSPASEWRGSDFHRAIRRDMARLGTEMSLRTRIFLAIPSLRLRRFIAR